MIKEIHQHAGNSDGMLALFGSIFDHDRFHVYISGASVVCISQGVSEGGLIGPLSFPSYMDTLTRNLLKEDCGVGIGIRMPREWELMQWESRGIPVVELTQKLVVALKTKSALPTVAELVASIDLEASALRALDKTATVRHAAFRLVKPARNSRSLRSGPIR